MKIIYHASNLALLLGAVAIGSASAEDGDFCFDVLEQTGRNLSTREVNYAYAETLYKEHCQGSNVKSSSNINAGLEAAIEGVPFKFKLGSGSTKDKIVNFCKTYYSEASNNADFYSHISTVSRDAISAWSSCMGLKNNGVRFRPDIKSTQVTLEVQRTDQTPTTVEGVIFDSSLLSCSAPSTDASESRIAVDSSTKKTLDGKVWSVTCLRSPLTTAQEDVYPRADLTISTTRGTFSIVIPSEAKFPYQWSSEIASEVASARNETTAVASELRTVAERVTATAIKLGPVNEEDPQEAVNARYCSLGSMYIGSGGSQGWAECKLEHKDGLWTLSWKRANNHVDAICLAYCLP